MGRVFLSYARDDLRRAAKVAQALEAAGHEVWWDSHLKGGSEYSREIDEALKSAEAVVVLWSQTSVDSEWVRDEAAAGKQTGRLIPARIDATDPPLGFRQHHTIDLSSRGAVGLRLLVETVDSKLGTTRPSAKQPAVKRATARPKLLIAGVAVVIAIAAAFLLWRGIGTPSSVPVIAVVGADSSPRSQAMAHDLLVKLGNLHAAKADKLQLTGESQAGETDLRLVVGRSNEAAVSRATLVLQDGRSEGLLWSKDFELPRNEEADLQLQVAFTAGQALDCALEALSGARSGLTGPVLKLYLNGCAVIGEVPSRDLMPMFRQVTADAPRFEGGWARLLLVEILATINTPLGDDPAFRRILRQDIAQARKVNPNVAEGYLAEALLLAPTDHAGRLRLVDLAIERNPTHPVPFGARAYYLRFVGRMNEAVESAKRATELDPLSPSIRNDYINALTHAGQFDSALHELDRAERLWPGAKVVREARFRLHMRYGDAKEALRLTRSGASTVSPQLNESFLLARIDPTRQNVDTVVRLAWAQYRRDPTSIGVLAPILGAFDREEELFSLLLDPRERALVVEGTDVLFRPVFREIRRDRRFMQVAKRVRLIDYWRQSDNWPDFCFEADLPYDCKTEAAKLAG